MAQKKWSDLTSGRQTAILVAGCIQLSLAATAWADLARTTGERGRGEQGEVGRDHRDQLRGAARLLRTRSPGGGRGDAVLTSVDMP